MRDGIMGSYEATLAKPREEIALQTAGAINDAPGRQIKVLGGYNTLKLDASERVTISRHQSRSTVVDTGAGLRFKGLC